MNYHQNVAYCSELLTRIRKGEKLNPEEKWWLQSNPAYNPDFGENALSFDILSVQPRITYHVKISLFGKKSSQDFQTGFSCVRGKGTITQVGDPKKYQGVKVELTQEKPIIEFDLCSQNGLVRIQYTHFIMVAKSLVNATSDSYEVLAMRKTILNDTKILYSCTPWKQDDFEAYQFIIEWLKVE